MMKIRSRGVRLCLSLCLCLALCLGLLIPLIPPTAFAVTTWVPIVPPPEGPSPQEVPYGTRLKELDISAPETYPDAGFKWYWGGDPVMPFQKGQ